MMVGSQFVLDNIRRLMMKLKANIFIVQEKGIEHRRTKKDIDQSGKKRKKRYNVMENKVWVCGTHLCEPWYRQEVQDCFNG